MQFTKEAQKAILWSRIHFFVKFVTFAYKLLSFRILDLAHPKLVGTHCSLIFSKVGVDPLLRTSIWKHLVDICDPNLSTRSTTIVITTHYIEEARAASRVGMMRSGKLLAEGAPDDLIAKYQKPTLEEIFLGKKKKSQPRFKYLDY